MKRHAPVDEQLAEMDLFRGLSAKSLRTVTSLTTRIDRSVGSILTREGRFGSEFVLLLDGSVVVSAGDRVLATRGPGDFLGEISLLRTGTQTATSMVTAPVHAVVAGKADFWALLDAAPGLRSAVRDALPERLAQTDRAAAIPVLR